MMSLVCMWLVGLVPHCWGKRESYTLLVHGGSLCHLGPLPYLCIKNETIIPLHVATQTIQRVIKRFYLRSPPYICIKNETMAPLHVTPLIVQRNFYKGREGGFIILPCCKEGGVRERGGFHYLTLL